MSTTTALWVGFNLFVLLMLALDLGVFNRRAHVIRFKEALGWCAVWISLAMLFNLGIYIWGGREMALAFLTGYLIEESLSIDNLFVFVLVFSHFRVPSLYQHRVLFWGILGALIMRALFIFTGISLIRKFHWVIYLFGAFLVLTGIRMALHTDKKMDPEKNLLLRLFRRFFSVTEDYVEGKFLVKREGRYMATPLLLVLIVVETTDLIFALDSIPAILAITTDPFIVYTSNVFAIMGLRSFYFALAGIMELFHYLHYGLSVILVFVGTKMLISDLFHIPIGIALGTVALIFIVSIVASLLRPRLSPSGTSVESESHGHEP